MSDIEPAQNQPQEIEIVSNIVRNPITGRYISTTSKVFKKLVNQNILKLENDNTSRVIYVGANKKEALKVKQRLKMDDSTKHKLFARNNKVLRVRRRPNDNETRSYTQEKAIEVYRKNKDLFNDDMSTAEIQSILKRLIDEEMIGNNTAPLKAIPKQPKQKKDYVIKKPVSESESETELDTSSDSDDSE